MNLRTAFAGTGTACAFALAGALSAASSPAWAQTTIYETMFDPVPVGEVGCTQLFSPLFCFSAAGGVASFGAGSSAPGTGEAVYALDWGAVDAEGNAIDADGNRILDDDGNPIMDGAGNPRVQAGNVRLRFTEVAVNSHFANTEGLGVGVDGYIGDGDTLLLEVLGLETLDGPRAPGGSPQSPGVFELTALELFLQSAGSATAVVRAFDASGIMTDEASFDVTSTAAQSFSLTSPLVGHRFELIGAAAPYSFAAATFRYTTGGVIPLPGAAALLPASLALLGGVALRRRRRARDRV